MLVAVLSSACSQSHTLGNACPTGYVRCNDDCCKLCTVDDDGTPCIDCTPGTVQCWPDPEPLGAGSIVIACDDQGRVADITPCPYGCSLEDAVCHECYPSMVHCIGDDAVDCSDVGVAQTRTPCGVYGCNESAGPAYCNECSPGAVECHGADLVYCDGAGMITGRETCAFGCSVEVDDDRCNACNPGTTVCDGSTSIVCTPDGFVASSTDCDTLTDDCNTGACMPTGCQAIPVSNGIPCSGDLYCEVGSTCTDGVCGNGAARDCYDGNVCTADRCDEFFDTCVNDATVVDGIPCDDGLFCVVGSTCLSGLCSGGQPNACDDGNPCTNDSCDEPGGACINDTVGTDGFSCDDGDFCTISDTCLGGVCTSGVPRPCDDGRPCTVDTCVEGTGCVSDAAAANGFNCDDGEFCTVGDTCSGGSCSVTTSRVCTDNNPCTIDSCDEVADVCLFDFSTTDGLACTDALVCSQNTTCTAGFCGGGEPTDCDDGNPCTVDTCSEAGGCQNDGTATDSLFVAAETLCCGGVAIPSDESNCGECGNVCGVPDCLPSPTCFGNTCVDTGIIVITELMIDPSSFGDVAEFVELYNPTTRNIDIGGWVLEDDGLDFHTVSTASPVVVPALGYSVILRNEDPGANCGITGGYQYSGFVLGNDDDEVILEAAGCLVDRVDYPSGFASSANSKSLLPGFTNAADNDLPANWCTSADTPMACGDDGTPGAPNVCP